LTDLKEAAKYLMDIYVPEEEETKPKELITLLDEAEGRMKMLLLETRKIAAVAALAIVKFHEPTFNLQKVMEDIDLAELVDSEDVRAAAEEVVNEGPIRRPERGREWEPIKILLKRENSAYVPNSQPMIPTRVCQGRVVIMDLPTLGAIPK
jgi:hypothetical protein